MHLSSGRCWAGRLQISTLWKRGSRQLLAEQRLRNRLHSPLHQRHSPHQRRNRNRNQQESQTTWRLGWLRCLVLQLQLRRPPRLLRPPQLFRQRQGMIWRLG